MKKLKFSLILSLVVLLALVAPFATYATEATGEPVVTSETPSEAVVTSETETTDEAAANNEAATADGATDSNEAAATDDASATNDETVTTDNAATEEGTETVEGETTEQATLEEVSGTYYETNSNLVFDKAVNGNAFLIGDTVTLKGQVNGDLFVIGKNVTLEKDAQIYGNVFLVAENFTHTGLVYNLFAMTTNYTCDYDGLAALDLKVFAENIEFSGYIERSAYFAANNINLTDDAYILGNLVYNSDNEPTIGENATIYGEKLNESTLSIITGSSDSSSSNLVLDYVMNALAILGTILLILFVVNFFKPNALTRDVKFSVVTILKALGVGLLAIIVLSIIATILLVSFVFTKAAAILLVGIILAALISSTVVIINLATVLYNKFNKGKSKLFVVIYTVLLSLIYFGISFIPYAGVIISLVINVIGFGLIVLWLFGIRKANKLESGNVKESKKVKEADVQIKDVASKDNKDNKDNKNNTDKKDKKDKKVDKTDKPNKNSSLKDKKNKKEEN